MSNNEEQQKLKKIQDKSSEAQKELVERMRKALARRDSRDEDWINRDPYARGFKTRDSEFCHEAYSIVADWELDDPIRRHECNASAAAADSAEAHGYHESLDKI